MVKPKQSLSISRMGAHALGKVGLSYRLQVTAEVEIETPVPLMSLLDMEAELLSVCRSQVRRSSSIVRIQFQGRLPSRLVATLRIGGDYLNS